jgi:hypothetical protein
MKLTFAVAIAMALLALSSSAARAQSESTYLAWTASTDAAANPSLTYNVYRATSCAGTFAKINAAPVSATIYLDNQPPPGSYCYRVTSVLSGVEGDPSNTATATILPEQPPPAAQLSRSEPASARRSCSHAGDLIDWIRCVAAKPRSAKSAAPPAR